MNKLDALIVGAGPAGTACALTLVSKGWSVGLIDKSVFPRPKVCGGFLGPQAKSFLSRFGLWEQLIQAGAPVLEQSVLLSDKGDSVRIPTAGEALGCSRLMLDRLLLQKAKEMGVQVLEGARLLQIYGHPQGFELSINDHRHNREIKLNSTHVIDTTGHRSAPSQPDRAELGVAALYEGIAQINKEVLLFCCRGGHVGLNPFEGGRLNVCYVVQRRVFEQNGCDPQRILNGWMDVNPSLRHLLKNARRLTPWKALYIPRRNRVKLLDKGIWHAGDSAGFIDPVVGAGIGVALTSGYILGEALTNNSTDAGRLRQYRRAYHKHFLWQRRLAGVWGVLAHNPWCAGAVIKILNSHRYFRFLSMQHSHPALETGLIVQPGG